MAARRAVWHFQRNAKLKHINALRCTSQRNYALSVGVEETDDSLYPPIKPRFPPGKWGDLSEKYCWQTHERGQSLLRIPKVKERLEELAGSKPVQLRSVTAYERWPRSLEFKKYITKSLVIDGLPDVVRQLTPGDKLDKVHEAVMVAHDVVSSQKQDVISDTDDLSTILLLRSVLTAVSNSLSPSYPHLRDSQFDEDVRLETFWGRGGFGEDIVCKGKYFQGKKRDLYKFQYKDKLHFQLRCEVPLPQFVELSDDLCQNPEFPGISYGPSAVSGPWSVERPITVSGHWIGDPCEFSILSCIVLPPEFKSFRQTMDEAIITEQVTQFGLMSSFACCVAQAYNQGFNQYLDVTYPFTTQTMLTDGETVQFMAYQLNTMHLWKDNVGNPIQNLCWMSEAIPLFSSEDKKSLNRDVLEGIVRCMMLVPRAPEVDLRPYLPEEHSPVEEALINKKGEEVIEREKIGRWQYPRNAVYF